MFSRTLAALMGVALTLSSTTSASSTTFFTGSLAVGTCSFTHYALPAGIFGTALSVNSWDSSAHCGACVKVHGPNGNTITAMIVDKCPGCEANGLDLYEDGFAQIADPAQGRVDTQWEWTSCGIGSPLQVHLKDGASQWWFSVQVMNANKPIADVQVSTDGGATWQGGLTRQDYNFFQAPQGYGTDAVDLKVTSNEGTEVVLKNVAVTSDNVATAQSNF